MEEKMYLVEGHIVISTEDGVAPYARLLMEEHLGKVLSSSEVVHHIDGNPLNNDLSNLKVMTRSEHTTLHNTGKVFSNERRRNMGDGRRGIPHSQETRDEMSRTRKGVLKSEETRKRMSAAATRRWEIQHMTWDLSDYDFQGG